MRTLSTALALCLIVAVATVSRGDAAVMGSCTVFALTVAAWCARVVACRPTQVIRTDRFGARMVSVARRSCVRAVPVWCAIGFVLALGWLRGVSHAPAAWSLSERGRGDGMLVLTVVRAATPGVQCEFAAITPEGRELEVRVASMDCSVANGDAVAVVASQISAQWFPRDPVNAHTLGTTPVIEVPRAWIHRRRAKGYWAWVVAQRIEAFETAGGPGERLVTASVLGLRSALPHELIDTFRRAGLGHLLAVSGLHVALVVAWLAGLGMRMGAWWGRPAVGRFVAIVVPAVAYVGLTGAAPSAVRAGLMLGLWGAAAAVGRPTHGLTLLAVAAAAMLVWEPDWIGDHGFHLSFAAMGAVVTAPPQLSLIGLSWRICWWTAPVSLLAFGQASIAGVIVNLVAIPVFSLVVLPFGLLGVIGSGGLAELAAAVANAGAELLIDWARVVVATPESWRRAETLLGLALSGWLFGWCLGRGGERLFGWWLGARTMAPRWRRHLPSPIAVLALLGALAWHHRPSEAAYADVYALVGPRSQAVVLRQPGRPRQATTACLVGAKRSPAFWADALPALGVDRLARVDAPPSYAAALRDRWQRDGGELALPHDCPEFDEAAFRRLRRACLARANRYVWLRSNADGSERACFVRGQWQAIDAP